MRWTCAACGAEAGTIDTGGGELRRETFTGVLTQPASDAARLASASGDAGEVHALDPELAPWWCPDCAASYCGAHWQRWDVFDGDLHDSIRGRCPRGHERLLED